MIEAPGCVREFSRKCLIALALAFLQRLNPGCFWFLTARLKSCPDAHLIDLIRVHPRNLRRGFSWVYRLPFFLFPALARILRTFLGDTFSRSATRWTFLSSFSQTRGITTSAKSSASS